MDDGVNEGPCTLESCRNERENLKLILKRTKRQANDLQNYSKIQAENETLRMKLVSIEDTLRTWTNKATEAVNGKETAEAELKQIQSTTEFYRKKVTLLQEQADESEKHKEQANHWRDKYDSICALTEKLESNNIEIKQKYEASVKTMEIVGKKMITHQETVKVLRAEKNDNAQKQKKLDKYLKSAIQVIDALSQSTNLNRQPKPIRDLVNVFRRDDVRLFFNSEQYKNNSEPSTSNAAAVDSDEDGAGPAPPAPPPPGRRRNERTLSDEDDYEEDDDEEEEDDGEDDDEEMDREIRKLEKFVINQSHRTRKHEDFEQKMVELQAKKRAPRLVRAKDIPANKYPAGIKKPEAVDHGWLLNTQKVHSRTVPTSDFDVIRLAAEARKRALLGDAAATSSTSASASGSGSGSAAPTTSIHGKKGKTVREQQQDMMKGETVKQRVARMKAEAAGMPVEPKEPPKEPKEHPKEPKELPKDPAPRTRYQSFKMSERGSDSEEEEQMEQEHEQEVMEHPPKRRGRPPRGTSVVSVASQRATTPLPTRRSSRLSTMSSSDAPPPPTTPTPTPKTKGRSRTQSVLPEKSPTPGPRTPRPRSRSTFSNGSTRSERARARSVLRGDEELDDDDEDEDDATSSTKKQEQTVPPPPPAAAASKPPIKKRAAAPAPITSGPPLRTRRMERVKAPVVTKKTAPEADAPKDAPMVSKEKTPNNAPGEAPKDAPAVTKKQTPENASESDAPEADAPEADAPETDAPKADAPKADAPKDAPALIKKKTPENAPEIVPAVTAEAPEADAPEANAPKDAPALPKKKTPENAPEEEAPKSSLDFGNISSSSNESEVAASRAPAGADDVAVDAVGEISDDSSDSSSSDDSDDSDGRPPTPPAPAHHEDYEFSREDSGARLDSSSSSDGTSELMVDEGPTEPEMPQNAPLVIAEPPSKPVEEAPETVPEPSKSVVASPEKPMEKEASEPPKSVVSHSKPVEKAPESPKIPEKTALDSKIDSKLPESAPESTPITLQIPAKPAPAMPPKSPKQMIVCQYGLEISDSEEEEEEEEEDTPLKICEEVPPKVILPPEPAKQAPPTTSMTPPTPQTATSSSRETTKTTIPAVPSIKAPPIKAPPTKGPPTKKPEEDYLIAGILSGAKAPPQVPKKRVTPPTFSGADDDLVAGILSGAKAPPPVPKKQRVTPPTSSGADDDLVAGILSGAKAPPTVPKKQRVTPPTSTDADDDLVSGILSGAKAPPKKRVTPPTSTGASSGPPTGAILPSKPLKRQAAPSTTEENPPKRQYTKKEVPIIEAAPLRRGRTPRKPADDVPSTSAASASVAPAASTEPTTSDAPKPVPAVKTILIDAPTRPRGRNIKMEQQKPMGLKEAVAKNAEKGGKKVNKLKTHLRQALDLKVAVHELKRPMEEKGVILGNSIPLSPTDAVDVMMEFLRETAAGDMWAVLNRQRLDMNLTPLMNTEEQNFLQVSVTLNEQDQALLEKFIGRILYEISLRDSIDAKQCGRLVRLFCHALRFAEHISCTEDVDEEDRDTILHHQKSQWMQQLFMVLFHKHPTQLMKSLAYCLISDVSEYCRFVVDELEKAPTASEFHFAFRILLHKDPEQAGVINWLLGAKFQMAYVIHLSAEEITMACEVAHRRFIEDREATLKPSIFLAKSGAPEVLTVAFRLLKAQMSLVERQFLEPKDKEKELKHKSVFSVPTITTKMSGADAVAFKREAEWQKTVLLVLIDNPASRHYVEIMKALTMISEQVVAFREIVDSSDVEMFVDQSGVDALREALQHLLDLISEFTNFPLKPTTLPSPSGAPAEQQPSTSSSASNDD